MSMKKTKNASNNGFLSRVDFWTAIYKEKKPDNGEDASLYSINSQFALVGAFDGCGGAGAKKYANLQSKTGAYIASRAVAAAVKSAFCDMGIQPGAEAVDPVHQRIDDTLQLCLNYLGDSSRLRSGIVKTLPSTAAFAVCRPWGSQILVDYYWAGDSRVYLLDEDGLAQLSMDDLTDPDPMNNLYNDGPMTNVVSKSKDYVIHHGNVLLEKPAIVFAATDGCFGYLKTPMEFEYLLLSKLLEAENPQGWERELDRYFDAIAGDDYTFTAVAMDFGDFDTMRRAFHQRAQSLYDEVICGIEGLELEEKFKLWNSYRQNYWRLRPGVEG